MKRITLNIDVEDNELFDKEAMELIKAKIKEQIRTTIFDEYIKDRITERIGERDGDIGSRYAYEHAIERYCTPYIKRTLEKACQDVDFNRLCMKYAQGYVERLFTDNNGEKMLSLNSMVDREIEKQITEKVQAKLKSVLGE